MAIMDRLRLWNSEQSASQHDTAMEDEGLIAKESEELSAQFRALQHSQRSLKRWISLLSVLLAVAPMALLLAFANSYRPHHIVFGTLSPVPAMPSSSGMPFSRAGLHRKATKRGVLCIRTATVSSCYPITHARDTTCRPGSKQPLEECTISRSSINCIVWSISASIRSCYRLPWAEQIGRRSTTSC